MEEKQINSFSMSSEKEESVIFLAVIDTIWFCDWINGNNGLI